MIGGVRAPAPLASFLIGIALLCPLSAWLGADASWDLRNYHLYNAHAVLAGTLWTDIAAAQLQSFYHPALDAVQFALRQSFNAHPFLLAVILALPHALAAALASAVAERTIPSVAATIAVIFGVTGAAGLPTVGTSMSEMLPGCLVLLGVGLLTGDALSRRSVLYAGLLAGAAAGLKLTAAPYSAGLLAAVAVQKPREAPVFLAATSAALLAIAGPWWWTLCRHTGNPLFPYFNQVFRSDWASPAAMTDTRFLPHDVVTAVLFPWLWAFRPSTAVSELPVRDPRLLLGCLGWVAVLARATWRRELPSAPVRALAAFWLIAFAAWEVRFAILRYAAILELLAGIPVMLALAPFGRWRLPVFGGLSTIVAICTIYPEWGRAGPGMMAADVRPPEMASGTLVLLLDPAPMAYVAAFTPAGIRFVGINNNLVRPQDATALAKNARAAVEGQSGPIWGLESPADQPGEADRALAAYHLARAAACVRVQSNLDANAILACPLRRIITPPQAVATPALPTRPAPG